MLRGPDIAAVVFFACLTAAGEAGAAVRICKPVIIGEIKGAAGEQEAKKAALDHWKAQAQKYGPGFDAWRIAADKRLRCEPASGAFQCVAIGAPCRVSQVAPRTPPPRARGPKKTI